MKGRIIIELDENRIKVSGAIGLRNIIDEYKIIRALAVCIGVKTPEDWARLSLYALSKMDSDDFEGTKVVIPIKKGE